MKPSIVLEAIFQIEILPFLLIMDQILFHFILLHITCAANAKNPVVTGPTRPSQLLLSFSTFGDSTGIDRQHKLLLFYLKILFMDSTFSRKHMSYKN